jgi:two-component system, cell cycle sensor histidine kinase and response regulator CckA
VGDAEESLEAQLAAARARIADLEKELEEARPLARMCKLAPAFVAEADRDGRVLCVNHFAAGFTPEDVIGKTIYDFIAAEHVDALRGCLERVVATKKPDGITLIGAGAERRATRYYMLMAPIIGDGEVIGAVLIATDVSPATEAMRALEESEAKLRLVLDASRMGTFVVDPAHPDLIASGDERLREIAGVDAVGVPATTNVHPDDIGLVQAGIAEVLGAPGARGPYEIRLIRPDGSIRWVEAFGAARREPSGEVSIVGGVLDVTERKMLEDAIARTEKLESIGRLAGGIAHDFNNMLTAILSYVDLALDAVEPESSVAEDLREIRTAAERSAALTKQILSFAREQAFSPRPIDPNELVLGVDNLLRRVLGEDVELVTVLEASALVAADRHQLEQVLLNLATNARHAMKSGGRFTLATSNADVDRATASRLAISPGRIVKLTASDTGEGMTDEVRLRAFEPFFTTKGHGLGTGLGLSTSYGIIRKHRGAITVSSIPGEGTTFEIVLPVTATDVPEVTTPRAVVRAKGGSECILVVEDEPRVRNLVVKTLERQGYKVLEARNGLEAVAIIESRGDEIDLVLSDHVMPQMSGLQLARHLRKERPSLRVIIMSGYSDESVARAELGLDFLPKPFVPEQVLGTVREVLDRPRTMSDDG